MNPVKEWQDFLATMDRRAVDLFERHHRRTHVAGIMLAPRHLPETEPLLKSIRYWHARSGDWFDFYWPGYSFRKPRKHSFETNVPSTSFRMMTFAGTGSELPNTPLVYLPAAFSNFLDRLHDHLSPIRIGRDLPHFPYNSMYASNRYSGGVDLLLLDVHYQPGHQKADLDFCSGVFIHLSQLRNIGSVLDAHTLFESLRHYCEYLDPDSPTQSFISDIDLESYGLKDGPSSRALLSSLWSACRVGADLTSLLELIR